jgi:formylglycine-generating enzyme required for sulfatase activity
MSAADTQVENEGTAARRARIRHSFWIGRTELTVGQWQEFVTEAHYQSDAVTGFAILDSYPQKRPEDHPAAWITWRDAVAFCEWLTKREQHANRLPEHHIYRLPSEAEWEYACRGGRRDGMFWWGDSPADGNGRLNWSGSGSVANATLPVDASGARGRNGFGLADMLGNVRELCLDAWDPAGAAEVLCADYTKSKARVLKGGGFKSAAHDARIARRWSNLYSGGGSDIGFRLSCGINLSNEVARVLQKLAAPGAKPSP